MDQIRPVYISLNDDVIPQQVIRIASNASDGSDRQAAQQAEPESPRFAAQAEDGRRPHKNLEEENHD